MKKKSAKVIGKKKATGKLGRPAFEITDAICEKAQSLASQGLTMKQIAAVLGMGNSTLYKKQADFIEFSDTIKKGRVEGIIVVANALFEKAKRGNTTAIIFYLKSRDPENWEDVQKRQYMNNNEESSFPKNIKITVVHADKQNET